MSQEVPQGGSIQTMQLSVAVEIAESPEPLYSNHVEFSPGPFDTEVIFARVPSRLTLEKMEEVAATGTTTVVLSPVARVVIPNELVPRMIAALKQAAEMAVQASSGSGSPPAGS